ncbi:MAG: cytochrome c-type biogenesis protein CcmH [Alphaproteobacteria bacterium]|nr:cytochrome c-type biogenesis protein CcmH [Alphaproteobacteria bacterium]
MTRRLVRGGALAALALLAALTLVAPAQAVLDPREMLADPAQEARARAIGRELRCLVCQNQSIDDSNADLARDLRMIVRERVAAGDSDEAVLQFVVARYGEFVLLRPPLNAATIALWAAPAIVLAFGALGVVLYFRRRRSEAGTAGAEVATPAAAPLSPEEQARLARLLDGGDRPA